MAANPKSAQPRRKPSDREAIRPAAARPPKNRSSTVRKRRAAPPFWSRKNLSWIILEAAALTTTALLGTMLILGSSADTFAGSSFFSNLLPFAAGIAAWVIVAAALLLAWLKWRPWLADHLRPLPAVVACSLCAGLLWFVLHDGYRQAFTHFRSLVGGKQQAARTTLTHQVYAAYRRHGVDQLQKMLIRSQAYQSDIQQAAAAFSMDVHVLQGLAATESSFMPRTSHDGGLGLFQITSVPKFILHQAAERLAVAEPDLSNPRHNAFVAAATLKHYLAEMKDDLFLGLLAYNIGPRNGGLRFIMQQYGANDFITMQPYLQQLPRDYPIRVLSYALAFKLWQQDGKLLAYQEGDNALHIQRLGIPGLPPLF
ncbi:MAG: transglycosylase SLT domain-containing protein [Methylomonas sp.]|nr:transglycosylase SLT domain-containing protein [Methylomonas sp.]